jgi:hypothetical protein
VLVFALALSVAPACSSGCCPRPAWRAATSSPVSAKAGAACDAAAARDRVRTALVAAQVALAVTLLVGAGLLIRTALHLQKVAAGFDMNGVLTASLTLPPAGDAASMVQHRRAARSGDRPDAERRRARDHDAGAARPGGNSNGILAEEWGLDMKRVVDARLRIVTNGYFRRASVPILKGRGFEASDRAGAPARRRPQPRARERIWPGQDPIGKRIMCCRGHARGSPHEDRRRSGRRRAIARSEQRSIPSSTCPSRRRPRSRGTGSSAP